ncbi:hypothetical protein [Streptosporangium amethystogenes]|nr:hypothetical protein [Streptosporangium amethystogenes]
MDKVLETAKAKAAKTGKRVPLPSRYTRQVLGLDSQLIPGPH